MSETIANLQRKIHSAADLQAVVSTMKAIATTSIGQYADSVSAQHDYYQSVALALMTCLKHSPVDASAHMSAKPRGLAAAVVFGSDQGLVGQFNELLADYVAHNPSVKAANTSLWAVGERIQSRLKEYHLPVAGSFALPDSITAISPLVTEILAKMQTLFDTGEINEVYLFHNRPADNGVYEQTWLRLLPLDEDWRANILRTQWPGKTLPEVLGDTNSTLLSLVHEYLFITLFRACAESLASENASRLAAMHRAEKNIEELLDGMHQQFHHLRQSRIDEELFDLVSGAEALRSN